VNVWVDLANSPHVPFFAPILHEMRVRGVEPFLTARDFAQTAGLARLHGFDARVVGRHGGAGLAGKGWAILSRALELRAAGRSAGASLAVSHNSYAHALAARSLGVPYVTLMDYEHTPANHVSFRLARRVLLPAALRGVDVARYGATRAKVVYYDGFKEQVYLDGFEPDRSRLHPALPANLFERVVVVARPPADFAVYHRFENPLFGAWLARAGSSPDAVVVVLPRTPEQREKIVALSLPSVIVPDRAVDGANLLFHADLVVSAGGTMNREAAILGVPAYSVFAGAPAAVDVALEELGRLARIRSTGDLERIQLRRKPEPRRLRNPALLPSIVEAILAVAPSGLTPSAGGRYSRERFHGRGTG
jgi:predicted glycosyltransferase